jgi:hypothetical protein
MEDWMQNGATTTLVVTALVAIIGYLLAHISSLRLARRKDRLDRVTRQLSEFYGPLYALLEATGKAWHTLESQHDLWPSWGADLTVDGSSQLTEYEAEVWRLWMTSVFAPLNRRMMEIIINHADLLIEQTMPQCLQDLCNHVVCYEPTLARWSSGPPFPLERERNRSAIYFPREQLAEYVNSSFELLKREQAKLLARVQAD